MTAQVAAFTLAAAEAGSTAQPPFLLGALAAAVMAEATPLQQVKQEQQTLAAVVAELAGPEVCWPH